MPRLKGSADLLEDRRKRALALLDSGCSLNEVGRRIGCNASSVMRWRDTRRRGGAKALRVRYSPGRPLKLNQAQRKRLVDLLLQGPIKRLAADKKNATRLGAHIVFADESGFQLIPNVVQTWAPQGQTPIHRHRQGRRDKTSVIS